MRSLRNRNQSNITENINNKRIGRNKKKSEEERNLNEEMSETYSVSDINEKKLQIINYKNEVLKELQYQRNKIYNQLYPISNDISQQRIYANTNTNTNTNLNPITTTTTTILSSLSTTTTNPLINNNTTATTEGTTPAIITPASTSIIPTINRSEINDATITNPTKISHVDTRSSFQLTPEVKTPKLSESNTPSNEILTALLSTVSASIIVNSNSNTLSNSMNQNLSKVDDSSSTSTFSTTIPKNPLPHNNNNNNNVTLSIPTTPIHSTSSIGGTNILSQTSASPSIPSLLLSSPFSPSHPSTLSSSTVTTTTTTTTTTGLSKTLPVSTSKINSEIDSTPQIENKINLSSTQNYPQSIISKFSESSPIHNLTNISSNDGLTEISTGVIPILNLESTPSTQIQLQSSQILPLPKNPRLNSNNNNNLASVNISGNTGLHTSTSSSTVPSSSTSSTLSTPSSSSSSSSSSLPLSSNSNINTASITTNSTPVSHLSEEGVYLSGGRTMTMSPAFGSEPYDALQRDQVLRSMANSTTTSGKVPTTTSNLSGINTLPIPRITSSEKNVLPDVSLRSHRSLISNSNNVTDFLGDNTVSLLSSVPAAMQSHQPYLMQMNSTGGPTNSPLLVPSGVIDNNGPYLSNTKVQSNIGNNSSSTLSNSRFNTIPKSVGRPVGSSRSENSKSKSKSGSSENSRHTKSPANIPNPLQNSNFSSSNQSIPPLPPTSTPINSNTIANNNNNNTNNTNTTSNNINNNGNTNTNTNTSNSVINNSNINTNNVTINNTSTTNTNHTLSSNSPLTIPILPSTSSSLITPLNSHQSSINQIYNTEVDGTIGQTLSVSSISTSIPSSLLLSSTTSSTPSMISPSTTTISTTPSTTSSIPLISSSSTITSVTIVNDTIHSKNQINTNTNTSTSTTDNEVNTENHTPPTVTLPEVTIKIPRKRSEQSRTSSSNRNTNGLHNKTSPTISETVDEDTAALLQTQETLKSKLNLIERKAILAYKSPIFHAPRLKGHWDYLLEEMQWLAVDYRQERRWKLFQSKGISELCVENLSHGLSPTSKYIQWISKLNSITRSSIYPEITRKRKFYNNNNNNNNNNINNNIEDNEIDHNLLKNGKILAKKICESFYNKVKVLENMDKKLLLNSLSLTLTQDNSNIVQIDVNELTMNNITNVQTKSKKDIISEQDLYQLGSTLLEALKDLKESYLKDSNDKLPYPHLNGIKFKDEQSHAFLTLQKQSMYAIGTLLHGKQVSGKTTIGASNIYTWLIDSKKKTSNDSMMSKVLIISSQSLFYRWRYELRRFDTSIKFCVLEEIYDQDQNFIINQIKDADVIFCSKIQVFKSNINFLSTKFNWCGVLIDTRKFVVMNRSDDCCCWDVDKINVIQKDVNLNQSTNISNINTTIGINTLSTSLTNNNNNNNNININTNLITSMNTNIYQGDQEGIKFDDMNSNKKNYEKKIQEVFTNWIYAAPLFFLKDSLNRICISTTNILSSILTIESFDLGVYNPFISSWFYFAFRTIFNETLLSSIERWFRLRLTNSQLINERLNIFKEMIEFSSYELKNWASNIIVNTEIQTVNMTESHQIKYNELISLLLSTQSTQPTQSTYLKSSKTLYDIDFQNFGVSLLILKKICFHEDFLQVFCKERKILSNINFDLIQTSTKFERVTKILEEYKKNNFDRKVVIVVDNSDEALYTHLYLKNQNISHLFAGFSKSYYSYEDKLNHWFIAQKNIMKFNDNNYLIDSQNNILIISGWLLHDQWFDEVIKLNSSFTSIYPSNANTVIVLSSDWTFNYDFRNWFLQSEVENKIIRIVYNQTIEHHIFLKYLEFMNNDENKWDLLQEYMNIIPSLQIQNDLRYRCPLSSIQGLSLNTLFPTLSSLQFLSDAPILSCFLNNNHKDNYTITDIKTENTNNEVNSIDIDSLNSQSINTQISQRNQQLSIELNSRIATQWIESLRLFLRKYEVRLSYSKYNYKYDHFELSNLSINNSNQSKLLDGILTYFINNNNNNNPINSLEFTSNDDYLIQKNQVKHQLIWNFDELLITSINNDIEPLQFKYSLIPSLTNLLLFNQDYLRLIESLSSLSSLPSSLQLKQYNLNSSILSEEILIKLKKNGFGVSSSEFMFQKLYEPYLQPKISKNEISNNIASEGINAIDALKQSFINIEKDGLITDFLLYTNSLQMATGHDVVERPTWISSRYSESLKFSISYGTSQMTLDPKGEYNFEIKTKQRPKATGRKSSTVNPDNLAAAISAVIKPVGNDDSSTSTVLSNSQSSLSSAISNTNTNTTTAPLSLSSSTSLPASTSLTTTLSSVTSLAGALSAINTSTSLINSTSSLSKNNSINSNNSNNNKPKFIGSFRFNPFGSGWRKIHPILKKIDENINLTPVVAAAFLSTMPLGRDGKKYRNVGEKRIGGYTTSPGYVINIQSNTKNTWDIGLPIMAKSFENLPYITPPLDLKPITDKKILNYDVKPNWNHMEEVSLGKAYVLLNHDLNQLKEYSGCGWMIEKYLDQVSPLIFPQKRSAREVFDDREREDYIHHKRSHDEMMEVQSEKIISYKLVETSKIVNCFDRNYQPVLRKFHPLGEDSNLNYAMIPTHSSHDSATNPSLKPHQIFPISREQSSIDTNYYSHNNNIGGNNNNSGSNTGKLIEPSRSSSTEYIGVESLSTKSDTNLVDRIPQNINSSSFDHQNSNYLPMSSSTSLSTSLSTPSSSSSLPLSSSFPSTTPALTTSTSTPLSTVSSTISYNMTSQQKSFPRIPQQMKPHQSKPQYPSRSNEIPNSQSQGGILSLNKGLSEITQQQQQQQQQHSSHLSLPLPSLASNPSLQLSPSSTSTSSSLPLPSPSSSSIVNNIPTTSSSSSSLASSNTVFSSDSINASHLRQIAGKNPIIKAEVIEILSQQSISDHKKGELLLALMEKKKLNENNNSG